MELPKELQEACQAGEIDRVHAQIEALLAQNPSPNRQRLLHAVAVAAGNAENGDLMRACHDWGLAIDAADSKACAELAFAAILTDDSGLLEFYLDEGQVPLTVTDDIECDMLGSAVLLNCANAATVLVERGADVNTQWSQNLSPLANAASLPGDPEDTQILRLLLENGCRIQRTGALHEAAHTDHLESVKILLDAGAGIEEPSDYAGSDLNAGLATPLWIAASQGNGAIVRYLAERGANLQAKDTKHSRSPAEVARINGHEETAAILEDLNKIPNGND